MPRLHSAVTCGFFPATWGGDFSGVGRGAKLAVWDFGDDGDALSVPSSYADELLEPVHTYTHIHTHTNEFKKDEKSSSSFPMSV